MNTPQLILALIGLYAGLGIVVAVGVVFSGFRKIDHTARASTWGFKLLVFPGLVAFWPLMLGRWITGAGLPPEERNSHRMAVATASVADES